MAKVVVNVVGPTDEVLGCLAANIARFALWQRSPFGCEAELYRINTKELSIRIVSQEFAGRMIIERNEMIWKEFCDVPEQYLGEISSLILVETSEKNKYGPSISFSAAIQKILNPKIKVAFYDLRLEEDRMHWLKAVLSSSRNRIEATLHPGNWVPYDDPFFKDSKVALENIKILEREVNNCESTGWTYK